MLHSQNTSLHLHRLAVLENIHRGSYDDTNIIQLLFDICRQGGEYYHNYMNNISLYLRNNLENNIQLTDTLQLLCNFHPFITITYKQMISELIYRKYPPMVDFFQEIYKINAINTSLLPHFLALITSIASWIKLQVQDKEYSHILPQQILYIINFLYTVCRYEFQGNLSIEVNLNDFIFLLYRILGQDSEIKEIVHSNQEIQRKMLHSLFYFLANLSIESSDLTTYKHLNYSLSSLLENFIQKGHDINQLFVGILNAYLNEKDEQTSGQCLNVIKNAVINVVICRWSIQNQRFWLWKLKLYNDLLNICITIQHGDIKQVYELIKYMNKVVEFD